MSRPDLSEAKEQFFKLVKEGVPVAVAAKRVGVHNTTGYYWLKKTKPVDASAAVHFAELRPSVPAGRPLEVSVGKAVIKLEVGFDAVLLRQVIAALSGGER